MTDTHIRGDGSKRKYNPSLAFLAGALGGLIVMLLLAVARLVNLTSLDLAMIVGSMFTQNVSVGTWILGFVLNLIVTGLIGMLYGLILSRVWGPADWWHGLVIAIPHLILGGLFLGLLPGFHPVVPERIADPGYFGADYGAWTVILFILSHLVYGVIVGAVYHGKLVATGPTPQRPAHV